MAVAVFYVWISTGLYQGLNDFGRTTDCPVQGSLIIRGPNVHIRFAPDQLVYNCRVAFVYGYM
jgi:hypothetical protein